MSRDLAREVGRERPPVPATVASSRRRKGPAGPASCTARPPVPGEPTERRSRGCAARAHRGAGSAPEDVTRALGVLLNGIAEQIAEEGTVTERAALHASTTPRGGRRRWLRLVDWDVPRRWLRAFGSARVVLGSSVRGPGVAARPAARRSSHERGDQVADDGSASGGPPARGVPARAVGGAPVPRWQPSGPGATLRSRARHEAAMSLPAVAVHLLGRPRTRSTAPVATGSAAARAGRCWPSCFWPSVSRPGPDSHRCCSRRPTTRCERCAGASRRSGGDSGPVPCSTVTCAADAAARASVDVEVLVHGHWNDALKLPGLGLTCSTAWPSPTPSRSRPGPVPAPAAVGGGGVHRPRGCPGAAGARRARAGARAGRPGDRDEPARREPPGAADPHLPAGR